MSLSKMECLMRMSLQLVSSEYSDERQMDIGDDDGEEYDSDTEEMWSNLWYIWFVIFIACMHAFIFINPSPIRIRNLINIFWMIDGDESDIWWWHCRSLQVTQLKKSQ